MMPIPSVRDWKGGSLRKGRDTVDSLIETGAVKGQHGTRTGMRLQPAFVCWMMGYPEDWLDLTEEEMPKSKGRKGGGTQH